MGLNGIELIQDCSIELTIGRRYGLIGQNGCGKTNFLQCLANREVSPDLTSVICSLTSSRVQVPLPCVRKVQVLSQTPILS
jgi:ATPase subunit of ABC transporter with duplicated ATPase domains